jgi:hypothetical protein
MLTKALKPMAVSFRATLQIEDVSNFVNSALERFGETFCEHLQHGELKFGHKAEVPAGCAQKELWDKGCHMDPNRKHLKRQSTPK